WFSGFDVFSACLPAQHARVCAAHLRYFRLCLFFFSSRRRHTRSTRDWSSDVCSSDLPAGRARETVAPSPTSVGRPDTELDTGRSREKGSENHDWKNDNTWRPADPGSPPAVHRRRQGDQSYV